MIRSQRRLIFAVVTLAGAATWVWANPYQTRMDREYKSLSNAISRAYTPPPPPPTRSYSPPTYSSSSSYSRSSTSSSSSSSPSSFIGRTPSGGSYGSSVGSGPDWKTAREVAAEKKAAEAKQAEARKKQAAAVKNKAAIEKSIAEWNSVHGPTYAPTEWATMRERTNGKAPLVAPPRPAYESRRSEFAYFEQIVRDNPTGTPWENMRLGQMCLLFEGQGAEPSRAEAFFRRSNLDWPEVRYGLGLLHLRGWAAAPSPQQAREHLERAYVLASDPTKKARYVGNGARPPDIAFDASRELAIAYDLGRGLPADPTLALKWYEIAASRPLSQQERDAINAMRGECLQRTLGRSAGEATGAFTAIVAGGNPDLISQTLKSLEGSGNAKALFEAGEAIDLKGRSGDLRAMMRTKQGFYLAAARLGHEPAARAFFSPIDSNVRYDDLSGRDSCWRDHVTFAREHWPAWEKKWLAAAQAGDTSAHLPLAFYYSGARGNSADVARAQQHVAKLPADVPVARRETIMSGLYFSRESEGQAWAATVWAAFGANFQTIDLARHAKVGEPGRAEALRDEGNALAASDLKHARDLWRDAAVLGDLPAQFQLQAYALRHFGNLGEYYKSLELRLKAAADAGDWGAIAALAALHAGGISADRRIGSALYETGLEWRAKMLKFAPHKPRFLELAKNPGATDEEFSAARAAVLRETETWLAVEKKWGLGGLAIMASVTLSPEDLQAAEALRVRFAALAAGARLLADRLPLWETTVEAAEFNPEADVRLLQALDVWIGCAKADVDLVEAVDYLTESAGIGHPLAPLAIAYLFGSGHEGFPKDAALSRRFRALSDTRLTAMAEQNDLWAQTMLGLLLFDHSERSDNPEVPNSYEWLPRDLQRGSAWLGRAAIAGAVLPDSFGDSRGRTVAYYLSTFSEDEAIKSRWLLIDELYAGIDPDKPEDARPWAEAQAAAQALLRESPAVAEARAKLDAAVVSAKDDATRAAAHRARGEARLAAGLPKLARYDANVGCNWAPLLPSAWQLLARVEEACGSAANAGVSAAIARALEGDVAAAALFEAAFRQLSKDEQEDIQSRLEIILGEKPDLALLKDLSARAEKNLKRQ